MVPNETTADESVRLRFGAAVKQLRRELGVSQEQLAERAGLHRTYVADVERGGRNLSLSSITKLARALEVSMSALLSRAGESTILPGNGTKGREPVEILVVEDSQNDIDLTLHAFKEAKITNPVRLVRDGAEAIDYLFCTGKYAERKIENHPQLVLLDLNLPEIGGIEVLRRIKSDERTKKIPVVVLTASHRDHDIAECRRLGAHTYIVKPVGFVNFSAAAVGIGHSWLLVMPEPG